MLVSYKKQNVCKPIKFYGKDGKLATRWERVGTLTTFNKSVVINGKPAEKVSVFLEIPLIGLEAYIFDQLTEEERMAKAVAQASAVAQSAPAPVQSVPTTLTQEEQANIAFEQI